MLGACNEVRHNAAVTDPEDTRVTPTHNWVPPTVLVVLLLWEAMRESGLLAIGDVFWHLRTGDLVLADGPPREDLFSWTAAGQQWRPNAWLGDALWATVRSTVGSAGVSLLAGVTVVALALLLYRAGRQYRAGPWASVASSGLAVVFLSPFISPRPLLLGFILLPIVLRQAIEYRNGRSSALAWVGVLVAAWSNLHGGYVVGVGIIGLFAIGWAVEAATLANPIRLAAVASVAGLLNPYGVFSYLQALANRAESGSIDEWQPLSFTDGRGILLVVFMVLTGAALLRRGVALRKRGESMRSSTPWATVLPIAVLGAGTLWSVRMGSFFLIVAAPVVARGFTELRAAPIRKWASTPAGPLVTGLVVAGAILAFQQAPHLADAGEPSPRFSESIVAAIPTRCRLLNEYDLGGFVIDRRWPEVLVSQDGRADLYGGEELKRQERLLAAADAELIEAEGINCVLIDRGRRLVDVLAHSSEWLNSGESDELALFVRR